MCNINRWWHVSTEINEIRKHLDKPHIQPGGISMTSRQQYKWCMVMLYYIISTAWLKGFKFANFPCNKINQIQRIYNTERHNIFWCITEVRQKEYLTEYIPHIDSCVVACLITARNQTRKVSTKDCSLIASKSHNRRKRQKTLLLKRKLPSS